MAQNRTTPFRDIWQQMAGGLGITTKLMRNTMMEDAARVAQADQTISEQLMGLAALAKTDTDREQLAQIADKQAALRAFAGHSNQDIRKKALEQMMGIGSESGTWLEDLESRQETLRDKQYELRLARRNEYKTEITNNFKTLRNVDAEYNKLVGLLNTLGDKDPAVQSAFRNLVGMSFGEVQGDRGVSVGLSLPGLGNLIRGELGGDEPTTYDKNQIIQAATQWRNAQTDTLKYLINELNTSATRDGFKVNAETGDVEVEDLNTSIYPDMLYEASDNPTNATPPAEQSTLLGDVEGLIRSASRYITGSDSLIPGAAAAGGAIGGAAALGRLVTAMRSSGSGERIWKRIGSALMHAPEYIGQGAMRGSGWGTAAATLYELGTNAPPRYQGESDEDYGKRLLGGHEEALDRLYRQQRRPTNE